MHFSVRAEIFFYVCKLEYVYYLGMDLRSPFYLLKGSQNKQTNKRS